MGQHNKSAIALLQEMTLDPVQDLNTILRKAYSFSIRLGLEEFKIWLSNELTGYKDTTVIPGYRIITSQLIFKSTMGNMPCPIRDEEILKALTLVKISDSVSSLQGLILQEENSFLHPLQASVQDQLRSMYGFPSFEITRRSHRNQICAIIDSIRTRLLEFAYELENVGITGESFIFGSTEKKVNGSSPSVNIGNFQGILGDITNSQVSLNMSLAVAQNDFESLRQYLSAQNISDDDINELKSAIAKDTLPASAKSFGSNVAGWIGNMVSKAASGLWDISASVAGGFLFEAIKKYYGL